MPTPRMYSVSTPVIISGAGSIWSVARRSTSETESTTIPTRLAPISVTTMRVFLVCSARGIPKRVRRSMIGMSWPRRLITPSMNCGARGTCVIATMRLISWTCAMSTPYSSEPSLKLTT